MNFDFRDELGKIAPKIKNGAKIIVFGAGQNWLNIVKLYKALVHIDLNNYVYAFADNDTKKHGTEYFDKTVINPSEIDTDNAIILIAAGTSKRNLEIGGQLRSMGLFWHSDFFDGSVFNSLLMKFAYKELLQFKNIHRNKRCFIIGNGPSLRTDDLDRLKNEITFATNKIYYAFDNTVWRPTYYVISDDVIMRQEHKTIRELINCPVFYNANNILDIDDFCLNKSYYYNLDYKVFLKPYPFNIPQFSEEPFVMHEGVTVTYICMQLAAYMGFKEIILLGADHNYSIMVKSNGELIYDSMDSHDHFDLRYDSTTPFATLIDLMTSAYDVAKEYAETHGFRICNATRGGKLEIFERVDFDSLFPG